MFYNESNRNIGAIILAAICVVSCASNIPVIKHKPGENKAVTQKRQSIISKDDAAMILQKAINSTCTLYYYGDYIHHLGYLGHGSSPPDPPPPCPASTAKVDSHGIQFSWNEFELVRQASWPGVQRYTKRSFKKHKVSVQFRDICEVSYAKHLLTTWDDQKILGDYIPGGDGLWLLFRKDGVDKSSVAPDKLSEYTLAIYIIYKHYHGGHPPGYTAIYRRWTDKNQPDYRKLYTILASLEVLCQP